jgi:hypothetical protein
VAQSDFELVAGSVEPAQCGEDERNNSVEQPLLVVLTALQLKSVRVAINSQFFTSSEAEEMFQIVEHFSAGRRRPVPSPSTLIPRSDSQEVILEKVDAAIEQRASKQRQEKVRQFQVGGHKKSPAVEALGWQEGRRKAQLCTKQRSLPLMQMRELYSPR